MTSGGHDWDDPPRRESQAFFNRLLDSHSNVREYTQLHANRWDIDRRHGFDVHAFMTPVYILGLADLTRLRMEHPDVNCVLLSSQWNRSTLNAKDAGIDEGVAIFMLGRDIMGALNFHDEEAFLRYGYPSEDDKEHWTRESA